MRTQSRLPTDHAKRSADCSMQDEMSKSHLLQWCRVDHDVDHRVRCGNGVCSPLNAFARRRIKSNNEQHNC